MKNLELSETEILTISSALKTHYWRTISAIDNFDSKSSRNNLSQVLSEIEALNLKITGKKLNKFCSVKIK